MDKLSIDTRIQIKHVFGLHKAQLFERWALLQGCPGFLEMIAKQLEEMNDAMIELGLGEVA